MARYKEQFPAGTRVRIVSRERLEEFKRTWHLHNPLMANQLSFAGREATVQSTGFYHGGDVLYALDGILGIWHEQCLFGIEEPEAAS